MLDQVYSLEWWNLPLHWNIEGNLVRDPFMLSNSSRAEEKELVKRPYLSFHFLNCGKRLIYTCKQKQLTCIGFFIIQTSFLGYKYCFCLHLYKY